MRRLPKRLVNIGDTVTCKRPVAGLNTDREFVPGTPGTVFAVDSPAVTYGYRKRPGGTASQVCVEFQDPQGQTQRARLDYTNVTRIPNERI